MELELDLNPILTFKTAKGSRYWVDEKGRSQRYKFYHSENYVEGQGMKVIYQFIIFVQNADASFIAKETSRRQKNQILIRNDKLYIVLLENSKTIKTVYGPFDIYYYPQLGLAPIEIMNLKYDATLEAMIVKNSYHIGNEIVDIRYLIDW